MRVKGYVVRPFLTQGLAGATRAAPSLSSITCAAASVSASSGNMTDTLHAQKRLCPISHASALATQDRSSVGTFRSASVLRDHLVQALEFSPRTSSYCTKEPHERGDRPDQASLLLKGILTVGSCFFCLHFFHLRWAATGWSSGRIVSHSCVALPSIIGR